MSQTLGSLTNSSTSFYFLEYNPEEQKPQSCRARAPNVSALILATKRIRQDANSQDNPLASSGRLRTMLGEMGFDIIPASHVLYEKDVEVTDTLALPLIRAAESSNELILPALLEYAADPRYTKQSDKTFFSVNAFVPALNNHVFEIPLNAAIQAQSIPKVATLLANGANIDGFPLHEYTRYASEFFRTVAWVTPITDIATLIEPPLTPARLQQRHEASTSFWSAAHQFPALDKYKGGDGVTPLEVACKHDSTLIRDMILACEPDVSFWSDPPNGLVLPDFEKPSALSVTNPLLCAIMYQQSHHLSRLLEHGLNPNAMPVVTRHQSYTPLMAPFCTGNDPDWNAASILLAHPLTEHSLLTPIMKVHLLHVVVAHLSSTVLTRVLSYCNFVNITELTTATGLTLLHIACLPLHITHVNIFAASIYESARELRRLPGTKFEYQIPVDENEEPVPQPTDFFDDQFDLVWFLLSSVPVEQRVSLLGAQDCHENTPLHYLVMHRTVNKKLLNSILDGSAEILAIYNHSCNLWGWSPEDLDEHGRNARVELEKPFWRVDHIMCNPPKHDRYARDIFHRRP